MTMCLVRAAAAMNSAAKLAAEINYILELQKAISALEKSTNGLPPHTSHYGPPWRPEWCRQ